MKKNTNKQSESRIQNRYCANLLLQFGGVGLLFGEIGDVEVEGSIFGSVHFSHRLKNDFFRSADAFVKTAHERRRRRFIVHRHFPSL